MARLDPATRHPGAESHHGLRRRRRASLRRLTATLGTSPAAAAQAFRFGAVGSAGFVVDAGVLWLALRFLGMDPYGGRALSFMVAVSTTFVLNRTFTFHDRRRDGLSRRWASFVAVNGIGGAVNYASYALLVASVDLVAAQPVLGVAAGSLAGFAFNFVLSRRLVFAGAAA